MNISLTRFLDFVNSNGLAKKAIVEKTMVPENYEPYKDFYKNLREAIISLHKEGASVDTLPARVPWTNEIKKKHLKVPLSLNRKKQPSNHRKSNRLQLRQIPRKACWMRSLMLLTKCIREISPRLTAL